MPGRPRRRRPPLVGEDRHPQHVQEPARAEDGAARRALVHEAHPLVHAAGARVEAS